MSFAGQAMASTVARVMAKKLRELIQTAWDEGNERAVELLTEALREAESIKAQADDGWY